MNFNEWYESLETLPKVQNYHRNTMEYFLYLKTTFSELKVNDGMHQMYIKMNDSDEITELCFFYVNRVSVISLNSIMVSKVDLFFSNLQKVIYEFEINSRTCMKLTLEFGSDKLILYPDVDAGYEALELEDYNEKIKKIYELVK